MPFVEISLEPGAALEAQRKQAVERIESTYVEGEFRDRLIVVTNTAFERKGRRVIRRRSA